MINTPYELPTQSHEEQHQIESGLEVVSPHKSIAAMEQYDDSLPEIGVISTSWIGYIGKQDLLQKVRDETARAVSKTLHCELRTLVSTCLRAFESAGMLTSESNDVKTAIEMCSSYFTSQRRVSKANLAPTAKAWKENSASIATAGDTTQLATDILGKQLVDTIQENHREPPHVSVKLVVTILRWSGHRT